MGWPPAHLVAERRETYIAGAPRDGSCRYDGPERARGTLVRYAPGCGWRSSERRWCWCWPGHFSRASIEAALDAYLGCWVFLVALVPLRTPRAALPAPGAPVSVMPGGDRMAIGYPPRARAADARRESIFRRGHSRRAQRTPSPKPASQRSRAAPAVRSNGGDPGPGVARLSLPRQRGGRRPAAAAGLGVSQACNVWARAVEDRRRRGPTPKRGSGRSRLRRRRSRGPPRAPRHVCFGRCGAEA